MPISDAFSRSDSHPALRGLVRTHEKTRRHQSLKAKEQEIERLVLSAKAGDAEAFGELYDIFVDPLYRYVYYRVRTGEVEDLLEIVFLKIYQNIYQYRTGENSFSAWAYRIAHNVIIDYYRSSNGNATAELHENMADEKRENHASHRAVQKITKETLKKALQRTKDTYQQIIILKYFNELENDEIEQILGKSQNAIRILLFRALRALKNELSSMGITEWEM